MNEIVLRIHHKTPSLNSRYWDQLFDPEVLPPEHLSALGNANMAGNGVVEAWIYHQVRGRFTGIRNIRDSLVGMKPQEFSLKDFLAKFTGVGVTQLALLGLK